MNLETTYFLIKFWPTTTLDISYNPLNVLIEYDRTFMLSFKKRRKNFTINYFDSTIPQ